MQPVTRRRMAGRSSWLLLVGVALCGAVLALATLADAEAPGNYPAAQANRLPPLARQAPASSTPASPAPGIRGPGPTTQLVLIKVVRGGPATSADWTLYATGSRTEGATNLAGVSPVDSAEQWAAFRPDVYALSETYTGADPAAAARYIAGGWTCVDNQTGEPVEVTPEGKVIIVEGADVTCTIVNEYQAETPTPTPSPTPSPSPTPPGGFRIVGRKLYYASDGPYAGQPVGLSGWTITATLVGAEGVTATTTTDALGGWAFTQAELGPLAFGGATLRICEEDRTGWRHLTPPCVTVTLPSPLPPAYTVVTPDFVNAQILR